MTDFQWKRTDQSKESLSALETLPARYGIPVKATSGYRPGSITNSGSLSYHHYKMACDFSGKQADMTAFAQRVKAEYKDRLLELIYDNDGFIGVWNGQDHVYSAITRAQHRDHVHVALTGEAMGATGTTPVSLTNPLVPDVVEDMWDKLKDPNTWLQVELSMIGLVLIGLGIYHLAK